MGRTKLTLALLALGVSLALFVLVRGERHVALSYVVPCEVAVPPGLALTAPLPPDVTVTFSGPWRRLRSLSPADVGPIRIDFSRVRAGSASWSVRPESLHLPRDVHVDSVFPAQGTADLRPAAPAPSPPQPRRGAARRLRGPESER